MYTKRERERERGIVVYHIGVTVYAERTGSFRGCPTEVGAVFS